jgi:hypothetical protein
MSTRPHVTKTAPHATHPTTTGATLDAAVEPVATASPPAAHTAPAAVTPAPTLATPDPPPPVTPSPVFLAPPPAGAKIPSVPDGFEPTNGANYRGTQPRTSELVALPLAVRDLGNFKNYDAVVGTTAPPFAEVQQVFGVTYAWSSMRTASSAWDAYARDQASKKS